MSDSLSHHWLALDFGSTHSRLWRMRGGHAVAVHRDIGLSGVAQGTYPAFIRRIRCALDAAELPMLCCGMIGSRQGWHEVPYIRLAHLDGLSHHCAKVDHNTWIVPGVAQYRPHYDVMRGEETQLIAVLHAYPDWRGHCIFPGTHSKWIDCAHGRAHHITTYLTGEAYHLFSQYSLLAPLLHEDGSVGFAEGVQAAQQDPSATRALFSLRARALLADDVAVAAYLSGYLIGLEFVGKAVDGTVTIVADGELATRYSAAATALGWDTRCYSADAAVRDGLSHLARDLFGFA